MCIYEKSMAHVYGKAVFLIFITCYISLLFKIYFKVLQVSVNHLVISLINSFTDICKSLNHLEIFYYDSGILLYLKQNQHWQFILQVFRKNQLRVKLTIFVMVISIYKSHVKMNGFNLILEKNVFSICILPN